MGSNLLQRIGDIHQKLADNHLPHTLVYTTGIFTVVLGVVFLVDAETFARNATFALTFRYARPEVWGIVIGATGILMMFGFWTKRTAGRAPAFILTLVFSALGLSSVHEPLTNPDGPALLSASAVYTFVAIICAICILACSSKIGVSDARPFDDHLNN